MLSLKSLNTIMHAPSEKPEQAALDVADNDIFELSQEDQYAVDDHPEAAQQIEEFKIPEDQLIRYAIQGAKKCMTAAEKYFAAFASDHGKDQSFINLCLNHQSSAK